MADKYKALRDALAAGPTDGPWEVKLSDNATPHIFHGDDFAEIDEYEKLVCVMPAEITRLYNSFANAKHIAAANPETIRNLLAERDQLLQALSGLVDDVEGLISESYGVTGLHLNGDVADWEELLPSGAYERLTHLDIAKEAIASATGEPHD